LHILIFYVVAPTKLPLYNTFLHYAYIGSFNTLLGSSLYNVANSTEGYNKINNWPLNFLRTGYYSRSYGYIDARVTNGHWWSTTSGSATYGRYLDTSPSDVTPQRNYYRGYGFAVRCVVREG